MTKDDLFQRLDWWLRTLQSNNVTDKADQQYSLRVRAWTLKNPLPDEWFREYVNSRGLT